jgi:obg-like ATPase 1
VEGDVDPLRDMEIIQNELRLKDVEWVQKQLEGLKKTGRSLGSNSLADKARKEEIVRVSPRVLSVQEDTRLLGYRRESTQVSE